jgi:hypothetical protein
MPEHIDIFRLDDRIAPDLERVLLSICMDDHLLAM